MRIIVCLCSIALAFNLAGCGKGNKSNGGSAPPIFAPSAADKLQQVCVADPVMGAAVTPEGMKVMCDCTVKSMKEAATSEEMNAVAAFLALPPAPRGQLLGKVISSKPTSTDVDPALRSGLEKFGPAERACLDVMQNASNKAN